MTEAQVADDHLTLDGVDVGVHVAHAHALRGEVLGEVLRHLLRQRRHQHPLALLGALPCREEQVVDLAPARLDGHLGVDEAGRPDHLLDDRVGQGELLVRGRGRDEHDLPDPLQELVLLQRTVVEGGGEPEAEVDERLLAGAVPVVHATDLREHHVRLVEEDDEVVGEVVEQGVGRRAGGPVLQVAGVVLDAGAVAEGPKHLEVVERALAQALLLEELPDAIEVRELLLEVSLDHLHGRLELVVGRDVVPGGEDRRALQLGRLVAGERVDEGEPVDLVAPQLYPQRLLLVGRPDLDHVAASAEAAGLQLDVVALVLLRDERAEDLVARQDPAHVEQQVELLVLVGGAQAVDGRHRGDDDDVLAREQAARGRVPQALELQVDVRVLLDEEVAGRDVRLRLVVVVVGDEELDRGVGEELPELGGQLRREDLVRRQHQRRPLDLLDDLGHRVGLAGARGSQQGLEPQPVVQALHQTCDGLWLIPLGLERRPDL